MTSRCRHEERGASCTVVTPSLPPCQSGRWDEREVLRLSVPSLRHSADRRRRSGARRHRGGGTRPTPSRPWDNKGSGDLVTSRRARGSVDAKNGFKTNEAQQERHAHLPGVASVTPLTCQVRH